MTAASSNSGSVTIEQLVALNDEIAALARAGVPIGRGLLDLGGDLPGRLGELANRIGRRLEEGQPLEEALAEQEIPAAYQAIVAAGVRSGRLAVALEDVASLIRRVSESRRMVWAALVYPLALIVIAYYLFVFLTGVVFPKLFMTYEQLVPDLPVIGVMQWLAAGFLWWSPWLPLVGLACLSIWWWRSHRAVVIETRGAAGHRRRRRMRFPTVGNLMYAGRMATFAETLALLIEHGVPAPEAVALAADASGDAGLRCAKDQLAERLRAGATVGGGTLPPHVPATIGWLLQNSRQPEHLVRSLRQMGQSYRRRAQWMSRWLSVMLPVLLTAGIGGAAVLLYALAVIGPWSRVLVELAKP